MRGGVVAHFASASLLARSSTFTFRNGGEVAVTHKERLLTAINHEEPDRVPICAWYTPEAEKKVLHYLGVDSDDTETYKSAGGPLPMLMEHDFLISWIGPCTGYYASSAREYFDEWGI